MLLALLIVFAQQIPPGQQIPPPLQAKPPIQGVLRLPELDMVGVVSALTREKQIGIEWTYRQSGQIVRHAERIDLNFWPTAIAAFGGTELIVAGRKPSNNKVVLLRITLLFPDWPGPSYPNTQTVEQVLFTGGGAKIKTIKPWPGSEHSAIFVRADGSVATINYETKQIQELYTPGLYQKLALDYMSAGLVAEHSQWGYVFLVTCDRTVHLDGGVVMKDLDRNGTIDEVLELNVEDWIGNAQWVKIF